MESAATRIADLNPNVTVAAISAIVHAGNVQELIRPWDFVIDGTDSNITRGLIQGGNGREKAEKGGKQGV